MSSSDPSETSSASSSSYSSNSTSSSSSSRSSTSDIEEIVPPMKSTFQRDLLKWYGKQKRDLPWRKPGVCAYGVWVSEVMSQQTRIVTVLRYWEPWMKRFPSVKALASAADGDVKEAWTGLGFYRRASALHNGAKYVLQHFDGVVPNDVERLLKIPGVGPYTAAAVASIAHGVPAAAVDGNVLRVYSRVEGMIGCDVTQSATLKKIRELAQDRFATENARDWNQAVMELGSTVCMPMKADCDNCPVRLWCKSHAALKKGDIDAICGVVPAISKKKIEKKEERYVALVVRHIGRAKDEVLMVQRPAGGLLELLWDFPTVPMPAKGAVTSQTIKSLISRCDGCAGTTAAIDIDKDSDDDADDGSVVSHGDIVHVFSHIHMTVRVLSISVGEKSMPSKKQEATMRWVDVARMPKEATSNLARKILSAVTSDSKKKKRSRS